MLETPLAFPRSCKVTATVQNVVSVFEEEKKAEREVPIIPTSFFLIKKAKICQNFIIDLLNVTFLNLYNGRRQGIVCGKRTVG